MPLHVNVHMWRVKVHCVYEMWIEEELVDLSFSFRSIRTIRNNNSTVCITKNNVHASSKQDSSLKS